MYVRVYVSVCALGGIHPQWLKEGISYLKLESEVVVNHLMWVLGPKPRLSVRAANTLNC